MKRTPGDIHYQWKEELNSYTIYKVLAEIEANNRKGDLFKHLAEESISQAETWRKIANTPSLDWNYHPNLKVKIMSGLIRKLGPRFFLDALAAMKIRGLSIYRLGDVHSEKSVSVNEKIHSKVKQGTNLRAALFGINDGLISNASLVFAMIGAQSEHNTVILTGVAGLLAGAFSMAAGEYISVKSQSDLYENQIALEKAELEEFPEEEAKELSLIYQAKGMDKTTADNIAFTLVKDKDKALNTLAREELGLNPDDLGSGLNAAFASFVSFSLGAIIPIFPFFIVSNHLTTLISLIISVLSLFIIGSLVSLMTGKSFLISGFKMAFLGITAGSITYLIGMLISG